MKRILKILLVIVILVALAMLAFEVRIKYISVVGNTKSTNEEIITELFKNNTEKRSIILWFREITNKKVKITYINSYDVDWNTPFDIVVKVNENDAVAFVKKDIKNVYFDRDGVINEINSERKDGIPEVVGINFKSYSKGEKLQLSNKALLNAILYISTFLNENGFKIELLEVKDEDNLFVYVGKIVVKLGSTNNIEVKLQRLIDIYDQISDLTGELDLSEAKDNMIDEQYIFKKTN